MHAEESILFAPYASDVIVSPSPAIQKISEGGPPCYSMPLVRCGLTMSSLKCSLVVAWHRLGKSNTRLLFRQLPSNLKGVGSKVHFPETPLLCALFYLKGPAPCCYWLSIYVSYRTFRPHLVRRYLVFC